MTEAIHPDDDSYIVRVKAVVMTRDDSSGGWLTQDGCLSRVGVCKVLSAELLGRSDFLIHGERLKDKQVILECFLKKDLVYTKATPTFHHWKVDNKKCGLTFQSPADARAFDRGVRKAMEDLTEGMCCGIDQSETRRQSNGSTTSSSTLQNEAEVGDDDVFTNATDSSSNSSQKKEAPMQTLAPPGFCEVRQHHYILGNLYDQQRPSDHYFLDQSVATCPRHLSMQPDEEEVVRISPRERSWLTGYEDYRHAAAAKPPRSEAAKRALAYCEGRRVWDSQAVVGSQPRPLKGAGERRRCVYCRDTFGTEENGRGRCQEAPDPVQTCIRRVSFMWCADSLLYHCMSDPEGDYSDPCSCDASEERFCLRWLALVGLSLLAPCMCCYAPLRACHRCGVAGHCCGGRHKAVG